MTILLDFFLFSNISNGKNEGYRVWRSDSIARVRFYLCIWPQDTFAKCICEVIAMNPGLGHIQEFPVSLHDCFRLHASPLSVFTSANIWLHTAKPQPSHKQYFRHLMLPGKSAPKLGSYPRRQVLQGAVK